MTWSLIEGRDVANIEAKIAKYEEENKEQIVNSRARKAEERAAAVAAIRVPAYGDVSVKPALGVAANISVSDINNDVMANDHPVATCSVNVDSNEKPEEAKDAWVIPLETSKRKHWSWSCSEVINPSLQLSQPLDITTILISRRKLLVLDVNGLLADIVPNCPKRFVPDFTLANKLVFKRPFCDDFLQFCFEKFDVGIWSSRAKNNLKRAVALLIKKNNGFLFRWEGISFDGSIWLNLS